MLDLPINDRPIHTAIVGCIGVGLSVNPEIFRILHEIKQEGISFKDVLIGLEDDEFDHVIKVSSGIEINKIVREEAFKITACERPFEAPLTRKERRENERQAKKLFKRS